MWILVRASNVSVTKVAVTFLFGFVLAASTVNSLQKDVPIPDRVDSRLTFFVVLLSGFLPAGAVFAFRRRAVWVKVGADGITISGEGRDFLVPDDAVVDVAVADEHVFVHDKLDWIRRRCHVRLRVNGAVQDLRFNHEFGPKAVDPTDTFLTRQRNRLQSANTEDGLEGIEWSVAGGALRIDVPSADPVPLSEVVAARVVEGHLTLWTRGRSEPVRLPVSLKSEVLQSLIDRRLAGTAPAEPETGPGPGMAKPEKAAADPTDDPLGHLIFRKDQSSDPIVRRNAVVVAVLTGLFGATAPVWFTGKQPEHVYVWMGMLFVPAAIAGGIAVSNWSTRVNILECLTRGVRHRTADAVLVIEYHTIRVFSFAATRVYLESVSVGTRIDIAIEARDGTSIQVSFPNTGLETEVERLRDTVSGVVAEHLLSRIAEGKAVGWFPNVDLLAEGVSVATNTGRRRLVPYTAIVPVFELGECRLVAQGVLLGSTPVSVPNFFPGLAVFESLRGSGRPAGTAGGGVPIIEA